MSVYRRKIEQIDDGEVITSYTSWVDAVQVRGENRDVYLILSPRLKRIWLQTKKRLLDYVAHNPANAALRSQCPNKRL
jgi:hypothetical protein